MVDLRGVETVRRLDRFWTQIGRWIMSRGACCSIRFGLGGEGATYLDSFFFRHLASTALRAALLRSRLVRAFALALPPLRPPNLPRATAAGFLVDLAGPEFSDDLSSLASSAICFESSLDDSFEEPLSDGRSLAFPSAVVADDWLDESPDLFSSGGRSPVAPSAVVVDS
jgi:hypothetical protein